MTMEQLLAEISRAHFPHPPATPERIAAFEAQVGWTLDAELRAFYLHCDGAELFKPLPDADYSILPLAKVRRARVAIWGQDEDAAGAASWYTLVDCQDTDFVLVDVARQEAGRYPLLDAYHGTYPEVRQIATSFREFLERAMSSEGQFFWLNE